MRSRPCHWGRCEMCLTLSSLLFLAPLFVADLSRVVPVCLASLSLVVAYNSARLWSDPLDDLKWRLDRFTARLGAVVYTVVGLRTIPSSVLLRFATPTWLGMSSSYVAYISASFVSFVS